MRCVMRLSAGVRPGQGLVSFGSNHGNEYEGPITLHHLMREIDIADVRGRIIIVPVLMMVFGMSDLLAKGTSLLMVVPTSISGTIGNLRRGNADLFAAAFIGVAACLTVPLGAWIARSVDPLVGNILFAVFIAIIVVQLTIRALRSTPRRG